MTSNNRQNDSVYSSLQVKKALLMAILAGVICLMIGFINQPFPILTVIVAGGFGLAAGLLQSSPVKKSLPVFYQANSALVVRIALTKSTSGKLSIWLQWCLLIIFFCNLGGRWIYSSHIRLRWICSIHVFSRNILLTRSSHTEVVCEITGKKPEINLIPDTGPCVLNSHRLLAAGRTNGMIAVRKRALLPVPPTPQVQVKSPLRKNLSPGSVRGLLGNWQSYRKCLSLAN
jgi:hypothetical protein